MASILTLTLTLQRLASRRALLFLAALQARNDSFACAVHQITYPTIAFSRLARYIFWISSAGPGREYRDFPLAA
ncbi:hypothetical protein [Paraburkholderia eburnea]|uniref:hypothetical protein n=1 Tax=Paraburkholderia eburnea TaxID=1189126 RepID=UPI0011B09FE4|nr:hypothetical protein [Paraburkholderia eburnea]